MSVADILHLKTYGAQYRFIRSLNESHFHGPFFSEESKKMKTSLRSQLIFPALLLVSHISMANNGSLPDISNSKSSERIKIFPSAVGTSFYLPVAFESEFNCIGKGSNKTCELAIFNRLSINEKNAIDQTSVDNSITALTGFDSAWIGTGIGPSLSEALVSQDLPFNKLKSNQNLPLTSGNIKYGALLTRVTSNKASELEQKYANEGLGTFEVDFKFKAMNTVNLIKIANAACLQREVSALPPIKSTLISEKLRALIHQCGLIFTGFDSNEAETIAIDSVRKTFFDFHKGFFRSKTNLENQKSSEFIITNIFDADLTVACSMKLPLKTNGVASTQCEEVENGN